MLLRMVTNSENAAKRADVKVSKHNLRNGLVLGGGEEERKRMGRRAVEEGGGNRQQL